MQAKNTTLTNVHTGVRWESKQASGFEIGKQ